MSKTWKRILAGLAVVLIACVIVVLWPTGDPLAGVQSVAIVPPEWSDSPQGAAVRKPFLQGLEVTLENRNITIVGDTSAADAVLAVEHVRLGRIDVRIDEGGIVGRATASCVLTDLRSGQRRLMDFTLTVKNGDVRARLVPRRFWEVWK
jgi:hypothetical protein